MGCLGHSMARRYYACPCRCIPLSSHKCHTLLACISELQTTGSRCGSRMRLINCRTQCLESAYKGETGEPPETTVVCRATLSIAANQIQGANEGESLRHAQAQALQERKRGNLLAEGLKLAEWHPPVVSHSPTARPMPPLSLTSHESRAHATTFPAPILRLDRD